MKFICGPQSFIGRSTAGAIPVVLYSKSVPAGGVSAGGAAATAVRRLGLAPAPAAWDLVSLALSAVAADFTVRRDTSVDGWTRETDLEVAVGDLSRWAGLSDQIASTLAFLTTDRWSVRFAGGADLPEAPKNPRLSAADSAVLLSGGLDSLIGMIDLHTGGSAALAVSHTVRGDKANQVHFAERVAAIDHLQVNHNVSTPWKFRETSQRARSLLFLAFAVLAATATQRYADGDVVPVYICENGFIAVNPALTPGRVGSLSTRTAHPHYLGELQSILDALALRVELRNPYAEKTKGQMIQDCSDPNLLAELAVESTSCGRYQRYGLQHCGRCLPCTVRRAAFLSAGFTDTTSYRYDDLSSYASAELEDLRAIARARIQVKDQGLDRWIGNALNSPHVHNAGALRAMLSRGLGELSDLLDVYGVA
ncbi:Qat anti-phage system QueC-like protein QatC [Isoptericola aurantiacus]|uniref:Qat anti-phage system QueC-like protein QatC n=1 Tax=Isoptericola aurantiacus TaxID=3377839 RepID=UPI00383A7F69